MKHNLVNVEYLMGRKLIHLIFNNIYDLSRTFLRFQEYYECPNPDIRGHFFSLNKYIKWYKTSKRHGKFTYLTDWGGFNFPSTIMTAFKEGGEFYPTLNSYERQLLDLVKDIEGKYYVIGSYNFSGTGRGGAFDHEQTHAMYFFNDEYREKVDSIIESHQDQNEIRLLEKGLLAGGYTEFNLKDEINAYHSGYKGYNKEDLNTKLYNLRQEYLTE